MKIIDLHCDAISKLLENPQRSFAESGYGMDVTLPYLRRQPYLLQNFAVYLSERARQVRMEELFRSIDLFRENIVAQPGMKFIRSGADLAAIAGPGGNGHIGALLSLEGVDALGGELSYVRILFDLGVRMIGITWNYANWAADGVLEPRNGGFTLKGRQLIKECNRLGMIIDVSHLSEAGFWELADTSAKPLMASHANAYAVCPHPRNLKDDQLRAIIAQNGLIGLTFVPYFVDKGETVAPDRLLPHIDHICSLGGADRLAFGSDFDGIDRWIDGLENAGRYDTLINLLLKHYRAEETEAFLGGNALRYLLRELPSGLPSGQ